MFLRWALIFFIVSIAAAIFSFGGLASGAAGIAEVLFYIFIGLFLISLVAGLVSGSSTAQLD